jgi:nickel/cobalt transporter (NicO) family protein
MLVTLLCGIGHIMFPAAQASMSTVWMISGVFGVFTIGTMMTVVALATKGLGVFSRASFARFSHALAGDAVTVCAAGMVFLGW